MASALYPYAKQALESGQIDLLTDTVMAALVDLTKYTYSAGDQFITAITTPPGTGGSAVIGTPVQLTGITVNQPAAGVMDANDATFSAVTGNPFGAVVLYKSTGTDATSPLIAYIDAVTGTPNGGDIQVVWDSGPYRIFSL